MNKFSSCRHSTTLMCCQLPQQEDRILWHNRSESLFSPFLCLVIVTSLHTIWHLFSSPLLHCIYSRDRSQLLYPFFRLVFFFFPSALPFRLIFCFTTLPDLETTTRKILTPSDVCPRTTYIYISTSSRSYVVPAG